jgi:serine/threonine protein kinase
MCKGIIFARKQIHCSRRMNLKYVKRELDVLKKLSHKHVVTLLGSYTQNNILGLLLYPAAACDLGMFLDELDEEQRSKATELGGGLSKLMNRLGLPVSLPHARKRLNKVYGCLANAIRYLHDHNVRHKDIKPRNILLDRNDGLYITDFGLSRDTTDASSNVTNGIERGTYKYCAPEVARYEPRGRAADIYSLGCVSLEINTVHHRLSLTAFEDFRTENEDRSFQNNPKRLQYWMSDLRGIKTDSPDTGVFDIIDIIQKMVSPVPGDRPLIWSVCLSLYVLGDLVYFGRFCATPRY